MWAGSASKQDGCFGRFAPTNCGTPVLLGGSEQLGDLRRQRQQPVDDVTDPALGFLGVGGV